MLQFRPNIAHAKDAAPERRMQPVVKLMHSTVEETIIILFLKVFNTKITTTFITDGAIEAAFQPLYFQDRLPDKAATPPR